jgi:hypothetical protein
MSKEKKLKKSTEVESEIISAEKAEAKKMKKAKKKQEKKQKKEKTSDLEAAKKDDVPEKKAATTK